VENIPNIIPSNSRHIIDLLFILFILLMNYELCIMIY